MKGLSREAKRAGSMRSGWRFAAHGTDRGQRFEVRYRDGMGTLRVYAYAEEYEDTIPMVNKIADNPVWHSPSVRDRLKGIKQ